MTRSHALRAALLLLCALLLGACGKYELKGGAIEPPMAVADFTLTDQHGQPFRMSDQRGKVVALFFGYTHCPDICPTAMADLASAQKKLGDEAEQLRVVFITTDPQRDTQQVVGEYVAKFDARFLGLTGSQKELEPIIKTYGAWSEVVKHTDDGRPHTIAHSGYIYLIDKQGQLRTLFSSGEPAEDIASDLRYLINE